MLRHVLGWGGVNVHVNLPHMHMLRHVLGWGVGVLTFMLTCRTCTCYITSWVWGVGVLAFTLSCRTCTCFVTSVFEEAHGHVKGGKHRARFQHQIPCKLQEIIKNALQIPGEF